MQYMCSKRVFYGILGIKTSKPRLLNESTQNKTSSVEIWFDPKLRARFITE